MLRRLIGIALLVLCSASLAEETLREFVDVKFETYRDERIGFELVYPYEWEASFLPGSGTEIVVSTRYNIPVAAVVITNDSEVGGLTHDALVAMIAKFNSIAKADLTIERWVPDLRDEEALTVRTSWYRELPETIRLQTSAKATQVNERWYIVIVTELFDQKGLGNEAKSIIEQFKTLAPIE